MGGHFGLERGQPLSGCEKIKVWMTVDGGMEDIEAYRRYGHVGLCRQRLLRINEEIVEQKGVPT